ncbi:hypothetical protein V1478_010524 [Vespula squamosa]|uniref:Uncharacterized protein n=1 Tax=Vespula squamosa TaxID=30214 RepID=A0ABD2AI08_VESSQ
MQKDQGHQKWKTLKEAYIKNDDLLVNRKIRFNENLDQKGAIHSIGQTTTFNFKDILTSSSNSEYLISEFPETPLVDSV